MSRHTAKVKISKSAKSVLLSGAPVNQKFGNKLQTPLFLASSRDSGEIAKLLISKGANVNQR